jgi:hypothetical protein
LAVICVKTVVPFYNSLMFVENCQRRGLLVISEEKNAHVLVKCGLVRKGFCRCMAKAGRTECTHYWQEQ